MSRYENNNMEKCYAAKDWLDNPQNFGRGLIKRLAADIGFSKSTAHKHIRTHLMYTRKKNRA